MNKALKDGKLGLKRVTAMKHQLKNLFKFKTNKTKMKIEMKIMKKMYPNPVQTKSFKAM